MSRKRRKDDESAFEEADLAVAELADGAFDAAFDAVRMEDGESEEGDAGATSAPPTPAEPSADAAPHARAGGAPTPGELATGVGLETPPEDSGEGDSEDSTVALPPAAEEREAPAAAAAEPPADDEPLEPRTKVERKKRRPKTVEEEAVQGRLEQLRLVEIVQMMEFGKKTSWVEVEPDDDPRRGQLGFIGGQCVWAMFGDVGSDEGFCSLCEVKFGKFRIYYGSEPEETNVESPTQFLLLEALRRIDEDSRDPEAEANEEADLEAAFMMDGEDP